MRNLIRHPIGAGLENDPDEIRLIRGTLKAINGEEFIPEDLSGFIDDDFDTDIRNFQQQAGLVEDGRLTPGGETERNLIARIAGETLDVATADETVLNRSVGDGGENDPEDVTAIKRALGTVGRLKYDRTRPPAPYIDTKAVDALRDLQRDKKLHIDGRADPDGETLRTLHELLEENPSDKPLDETQLALGPAALIPLLFFLARTTPQFARLGPALLTANDAAKKLAEDERKRRDEGSYGSDPSKPGTNGTTLPNIPPDPQKLGGGKTEFPPEDPDKNDGITKGRPTEPARNDPTVFPVPKNPENLIEVFPDQRDELNVPIIIERRGSEPIREYNARLKRAFETLGNMLGINIIHIGGSRDAEGNEIPETYLKNKETGGRKGSSFPDITLEFRGAKLTFRIHINTMDKLVDGVTPSAREQRGAERLSINMEDDAALIEIQKPGANETVDFDVVIERYKETFQNMKDYADGKIDRAALIRRIKSTEKLPLK